MRRGPALAGLALVVAGTVVGCAGRDPGSPSGDCAFVLRRDGHDYADGGFVQQDFRGVGTAEVALCRDAGPGPLGPYFDAHPDLAEVSSVGDLDPGLAVGVRDTANERTLRVLVRLDAPPGQVDAVMEELSR